MTAASDVEKVAIKRFPQGLCGKAGLAVEITINGFVFKGSVEAWPGSEHYQKFEDTIAALSALGDRQWNAATEDEINAVAHVTGATVYGINGAYLSVTDARKVAAATIAAFLCLRRPTTGEG